MHIYCILFNRNYLTRGLALHRSLERHCRKLKLVILCLDRATLDALSTLALPHVELVSIESLEVRYPELRRVRANRTPVEYCFTCKPALMQFALEKFPAAGRITYLDSDLYYFSDPELLEEEYSSSSVALTPHRFPLRLEDRRQYGQFNAGWVSASADPEGREFIEWWRLRCVEWCRAEVEADLFSDQIYLDQVPELFPNTRALDHPGANVAPWNLDGLNLTVSANMVQVNGKPLVFFHFHGMRRVLYRIYDSGLYGYGVSLSLLARRSIYRPYLSDLAIAATRLSELSAAIQKPLVADNGATSLRQSLGRIRLAARLVASRTALVGP
jgi:hypothetical protein